MHGQSPEATRYEPPVQKVVWTTACGLTRPVLLEETRRRCGLSEVSFRRLLWHGGLHVARRRAVASTPDGDLDDAVLPMDLPAGTPVAAYWYVREPEHIVLPPEAILLDEDGVVAVDKPSWLPVQGTRASVRFSLEHCVRQLCGSEALQAIHRLDRGTSGVNLFARHSDAARRLCRQFAKRTVHKEYLAVVWPAPPAHRWCVEGYLARVSHPHHAFYGFSPEPTPESRHSLTWFEPLEACGERFLVRAVPQTGRTHQLRVHLAQGGTPIVGDTLYGRPWEAQTPWSAGRLQLHAATLRVELMRGGHPQAAEIHAPTPTGWLGE